MDFATGMLAVFERIRYMWENDFPTALFFVVMWVVGVIGFILFLWWLTNADN